MRVHCIFLIALIAGCFLSCFRPDSRQAKEMVERYAHAYSIMESNPAEALELMEGQIQIANDIGDHQQLLNAYFLKGYVYDNYLQDPENALKAYMEVLRQCDFPLDSATSRVYLNVLTNVGGLYYQMAYNRAARDVLCEAMKTAIELRELPLIKRFTYSLAVINFRLELWSMAESYMKKGVALSKEAGDSISLTNYTIMRSAILIRKKEFNQAINQLKELQNSTFFIPSQQRIHILNNLGMSYLELDQLSEAEGYLKESLMLTIETSSPSKVTFNNLGKLAFKRNLFEKAIDYYQKAEALPVSQMGDEDQLTTYDGYVEVYTAMNDPSKALEYKQKSVDHIKPLVDNIDKLRSFAGEFNEWQRSREILRTKEEADTGMAVLQVVMIMLGIALLLGLFYMVQFYRRVKQESEIKVLREINELKDAIIANIRLLF